MIRLLLITITLVCAVVGCKNYKTVQSAVKMNYNIKNNIQELFEKEDIDGLYYLFSIRNKEDPYLLYRLRILMNYWNSLNLDSSHSKRRDESKSKSFEDGEFSFFEDGFVLDDYYDINGNRYRVSFDIYTIDKNNTNQEGVNDISICYVNTAIFSTSIYEKECTYVDTIDNYTERVTSVINGLSELRNKDKYIYSDDSNRVLIVRQFLQEKANEDYTKYGYSIINTDSIEDTEIYDGYNFYPGVLFYFADGSRFFVFVHNNP